MRTVPKWVNKIHEADKIDYSCIHSICYSPDGSQLIVAAGERVMVYDPNDGSLIKLLRGHKDIVTCVSYSKDGKKFASGGLDKSVIIWNTKLEGVLKYSHNESIQCLSYNPITHQLASCAVSDFAFWSTELKAVQKHKMSGSGRITSCDWSMDGQLLAIGQASGTVSIRNKLGEEKTRIDRNKVPVWAVLWTESHLLVGDWSETLSCYNSSGQPTLKERSLGLMPTCLSKLGDLILASGVGGWAVLTSEGVPVIHTYQQLVWSLQACPENNAVTIGCQDGTLWCYQIVFNTVHGLYRERYAYRENMTDVIIQHLTSGAKVRIKCHDRVQKIAIHKNRLAVQLPERVVIYEQGEGDGMLYRVKEKIPQKAECSLLVATSTDLLLCQDTKLTMIVEKGSPASWVVPASIRYVKVAPLNNKEVLLLGLSNGQITKVAVDSPRLDVLITTPSPVRCFDLSAAKSMIAVVDENSECRVYSVSSGQLLFKEDTVSSVSWHISCEELLCYSGGGMLSIKSGNYPAYSQPVAGSVVGFQGGKIFCLQSSAMQTLSIPLSHAMHQNIQNGMFEQAYSIACLGITSSDWELLGLSALEALSLNVAKKAFQHSENIMYLQLIEHLQDILVERNPTNDALALAEVRAYRGQCDEAARIFRAHGHEQKALSMYTDLRMFHKAQEYLGAGDSMALVRKKAEWAGRINEPRAAAEMFLAAGDVKQATAIMAQNGWIDMLVETGRNVDKGSTEALKAVADALNSIGHYEPAAEAYQRLGDLGAVVDMTVKASDWQKAFHLVKQYPDYKKLVYIPYAQMMARNNHFIEAQKAYHMGGETDSAIRVLGILIENAITEERFTDAAYLYWLLASQCCEIAAITEERQQAQSWMIKYYENERLASLYHAFNCVHQSIHEPFSLSQPETLFNAAKVSLSILEKYADPPKGISLFCLYLCLAKQGKTLGVNKLSRQMLDKLQTLTIPARFQESVEVLTLLSWARDLSDGREMAPLCYRCSHHLLPLDTSCHHCGHSQHFSYLTFESLPLVAFKPEDDISTEEALQLIDSVNSSDNTYLNGSDGDPQVLHINGSLDIDDSFAKKSYEDEEDGLVVCSREDLKALSSLSVVYIERIPPLPPLYYKNVMPDMHVQACPHCFKLFYIEDIEVQLITKGCCAFCRTSALSPQGEADEEELSQGNSPHSLPSVSL